MSIAISNSPTVPVSLHSQERQDPTLAGGIASPAAEPAEDHTATGPAEDNATAANDSSDRVTLSSESQMVRELAARDREVRAHEAAHAAAGGSHAGSPTFSYQQGPDGRSYAVGGEVSIDTSEVAGDPQATLEKAETIRSAALAPAQPSSADRAIAAKATTMAAKARSELAADTGQAASSTLAAAYQQPAQPGMPGLAGENNSVTPVDRYI